MKKQISTEKVTKDFDVSLMALHRYYGYTPIISGFDIKTFPIDELPMLISNLLVLCTVLSEIQTEDNYSRFKQAYEEAETIFEAKGFLIRPNHMEAQS